MLKNYYEILGLNPSATEDEIKKRFHQLSKEYHPDVNPNGEEKFKEINEAYEALRNKGKHQSIFSNIPVDFSYDVNLTVIIDIRDSYMGVQSKTISYDKYVACDSCFGNGGSFKNCPGCGGSGQITRSFGNSFFSQLITTPCNECGGEGKVITNSCRTCGGVGSIKKNFSANITIPKGTGKSVSVIKDGGNYLRGRVGVLNLYLDIQDDVFTREGNTLIYNLILINNAIFSDEVVVPHPEGELKFVLPKSYDTRKPIRLKGKGFNGGDFHIKIDVLVEK